MSTTLSRRARVAVVAAVSYAALLSGCGVADGGVSPGAAAVVGDETISLADVDAATAVFCEQQDEAAAEVPEGTEEAPQPTANADQRRALLEGLVLRELADGVNEDYDAASGPAYTTAVAQAETAFEAVEDDDDREQVVTAATGIFYFVDLMITIGGESLGPDVAAQDPSQKTSFDEGLRLAREYATDNPIRTNPLFPTLTLAEDPFGVDTGSGQPEFFERERSDLSVAVSDDAIGAAAEVLPVEYTASLPDNLRCG